MGYGLKCFDCGELFEADVGKCSRSEEIDRIEDLAGKAGWVIGLRGNGDANYACPLHANQLFNGKVLARIGALKKR